MVNRVHAGGPALESVVVGVACSRLVAVACGENNSNCFLYDILDIQKPKLGKVFNLSPAGSVNKAPGVAYNEGVLEENTAPRGLTSLLMPTGEAGILFTAGAISDTISFYYFECTIPVHRLQRPALKTDVSRPNAKEDEGLSSGAIDGIAVDGGLLAF